MAIDIGNNHTKPQTKENNTPTISQTSHKCPVCNGTGWEFYRKREELYKDLPYPYADYVRECPECNGGSYQQMQSVKEKSGIPFNFRNTDFTMFNWDLYVDDEGKSIDMQGTKKVVVSFYTMFDKWESRGLGLYIHSRARGTGKTMLAACICNELNRRYPWKIKFVPESELVKLDKSSDENAFDRTQQDPIGELCKCKLLVVDDLGATSGGQWLENILFRIMDERDKNKLVTIVTSNVPVSELSFNDRIVSRLDKICMGVKLPDVPIRASRSNKNKKDFLRELGIIRGK